MSRNDNLHFNLPHGQFTEYVLQRPVHLYHDKIIKILLLRPMLHIADSDKLNVEVQSKTSLPLSFVYSDVKICGRNEKLNETKEMYVSARAIHQMPAQSNADDLTIPSLTWQ